MNETTCGCCEKELEKRDPDPWEGRLDGYCYKCALTRCDAYPGDCSRGIAVVGIPSIETIAAVMGDKYFDDEFNPPLINMADPELEKLLAEEEAIERGEITRDNPMKGYGW